MIMVFWDMTLFKFSRQDTKLLEMSIASILRVEQSST